MDLPEVRGSGLGVRRLRTWTFEGAVTAVYAELRLQCQHPRLSLVRLWIRRMAQIDHFKKMFDKFDVDGSGQIDRNEPWGPACPENEEGCTVCLRSLRSACLILLEKRRVEDKIYGCPFGFSSSHQSRITLRVAHPNGIEEAK